MSVAQKILQMIEGVDLNDTDTLDEIDARVWCYLHGFSFKHFFEHQQFKHCMMYTRPIFKKKTIIVEGYREVFFPFRHKTRGVPQYARSRDALKAIRPEGWLLTKIDISINCQLYKMGETPEKDIFVESENMPTEELAELHAIIQAIAYERENK